MAWIDALLRVASRKAHRFMGRRSGPGATLSILRHSSVVLLKRRETNGGQT